MSLLEVNMLTSRFNRFFLAVSVLALGCPGGGDPVLDNGTGQSVECGQTLNPTCSSSACTTPSGRNGLCHIDSKLNCVCGDIDDVTKDPCLLFNNPKCEQVECKTEDGLVGKCAKYKD